MSQTTPALLPRRTALVSVGLAAAVAVASALPVSASAQEWPTKTVRLISPYPVGGGPQMGQTCRH